MTEASESFEVRPAAEVPQRRPRSNRKSELTIALRALPPGSALRVAPHDGQTLLLLQRRVSMNIAHSRLRLSTMIDREAGVVWAFHPDGGDER